VRVFGIDGNGVIGNDPGLRPFDDQHALADFERGRIFLRHGEEIAVLLPHDVFEAGRILGTVADDVADQSARHRSAKSAECTDRADTGLRSGDAARRAACRRAERRIGADRDHADADQDAFFNLVGLLDDVA
jgi:hypothetical protein